MADPLEVRYREGALLPALTFDWYDGPAPAGALVDFSVSHTWELKLSRSDGGTAVASKTTGITGAATAPNVTVAWAADDLGTLTAGSYWLQLKATRASDSKPRFCPRKIRVVIEEAA